MWSTGSHASDQNDGRPSAAGFSLNVIARPEIDAVLAKPLAALTPRTIVDPGALRRELARIRTRGFAVTRHEARQDVGGVAAAVVDGAGRPVGALSVTLPMHRLTGDIVSRYGALVPNEAARLTATLAGAGVPLPPADPRRS
ncbi:MAG TPA: IclR family transcriptional regulator C-terminal domain-containing protein [Acidimicrobiia bacterium]|nr:IclR family transcriptional regulator C-terminal domain-containing protein [Acidimicrobiia bacterium]